MVCKEDVFLWFKDLESYDRIEVMYELLNMCIPFEIRFLGSCIEEIGKHTFQELRGPSIIANDVERLAKDPTLQRGLANESTRHRAVIYMSVLSTRNCICANWFYRTLFKNEQVERLVNQCCNKEDVNNLISELLLLYTLAVYHPAFTYAQKTCFAKDFRRIKELSQCGTNVKPTPVQPQDFMQRGIVHPIRNNSSLNEAPIISLKSPPCVPTLPVAEPLAIQHPPPGLPPLPHPPIAMPPLGPSYPPVGAVVAPEVHPFTTPNSMTMMTQCASSPPQSRPMSPHRTLRNILPPTAGLNQLISPNVVHIDNLVASAAKMHLEPNLIPILPYNSNSEVNMKPSDKEVNHVMSHEKIRGETPWNPEHFSKQNGMRYPKNIFEHLTLMKMDPENSLHCSDSASSSGSKNQSPTETPNVTPAVTPQGPGRGCDSSITAVPPPLPSAPRMNGGIGFVCEINPMAASQQTLQQQMPPPPPQLAPQYTNCSAAPSYQQQPTRYMFAPFSHSPYPPHAYTPTDVFNPPGASFFAHSSQMIPQPQQQQQQPPPRLNCYNCGAMGHSGGDCDGQTIEEITETPNILAYDTPVVPEDLPEL